jgi:uncharacterized SAM-binding protein YcdF (DUF218 family)
MSARGPRRRPGRLGCLAIALAVALTGFGTATARLFVWPPAGLPVRVDAIVMLNGPGSRLSTALALARAHRAATVVISRGSPRWAHGGDCAPRIAGVQIICFDPRPATTRGEAEFAGRLARQRHWHSIALVTTAPQDLVARLRAGRCFGGETYVVNAPLALLQWPSSIVHEWGSVIRAVAFQRAC